VPLLLLAAKLERTFMRTPLNMNLNIINERQGCKIGTEWGWLPVGDKG
jgi:hypothetical protein